MVLSKLLRALSDPEAPGWVEMLFQAPETSVTFWPTGEDRAALNINPRYDVWRQRQKLGGTPMPFGVPSTQFPREERHDIRETFADSLSQCVFDGQTLRLELCSTRLDEAKPPPAKPTGRRHVVARIVLTPGGAIELINACMQLAGQFKQAGILKETPAPSASGGEATSAPAEQRPERINAQPTSLESLEQQMASLLRRSDKKL
jgi:hypothetical protein